MHDISTQILAVRQEPSRDGQSIKHLVSLTGGTAADGTSYPPGDYVTFEPEMSGKAFALINTPVDARLEIAQTPKKQGGGFWTNFNLKDVAPSGMLMPMAMPAAGGTPAQPVQYQQPLQQATQPQPYQQPGGPVQQHEVTQAQAHVHPVLAADELERSEKRRGFASGTAFEFIGQMARAGLFSDGADALKAARVLTDDLVGYRMTGTWDAGKASAVQADREPSTPQAVAQAANEELGGTAVQVGVPFDVPQEQS